MKKKLVIAALMTLLLALAVSGAMADSCDHNNWSAWTVKDNTSHSRSCQTEGCYGTEYENHYGGKATCVSKPSCEVCGRAYGKSTGVHEWVVTSSTDTQHTLTCPGCQRTQTADHSGGTATCSEKAKCETCGQAYGTTNDQHAWNYNSAVVVREATCQYGKVTQYSCYYCGTTTSSMDTQTLDCIGEPRVGKEATCTEEGYYVMVCKMCGKEKGRGDNIPCAPHSLTQKQALAPTCTEDGYYVKVCTVCGQETGRGDTIPKLGHDMVQTHLSDPTCVDMGMDMYNCSRCDYSRPMWYQPDGSKHVLGDEVYKTNTNTCCIQGYYYRLCTLCGKEVKEGDMPNPGHKYRYFGFEGDAKANGHFLHCNFACCPLVEGDPDKFEAHYGGKATCKSGALCEVCGYEYTEPDPLAHTMGNWYRKNEDHDMRECSKCDYYEITPHNYGDTVYLDEEYHSKKCRICGTVSKEAHDSAVDYCGGMQNICDTCGGSYGPVYNHQLICYIEGMDDRRHFIECKLCDYATEWHDATDFEVIDAFSHHTSCSICGWYRDFPHYFVREDMYTHVATCRDCGYTCAHTGGVALCGEKPICDKCHTRYGQAIEHDNHSGPTYYDDRYHVQTCYDCGRQRFAYHDDYSASGERTFCHTCATSYTPLLAGTVHPCVGGVATCLFPAKCDICREPYGEKVNHDYVLIETIPGTCEEPGKLVYECSMCKQRSEYDHYTEESLSYQTLDSTQDWTNALMYHKVRCEAHDSAWRTEYHFGGTPDANGVLTCAGCGAKYYIGTNNAMPAYHYIAANTNLVVKNPASDAEIGTTSGSFVYVDDALCFVIAADGNLMSGYSNEILGTIRNDMLYDTKGNMIGLLLGNELILGSPDANYDWSAALERYYTLHPELAPAE